MKHIFKVVLEVIALRREQRFLACVWLQQRFNYYCLGIGYPSG